jgi:hypothetical protein
MFAVAGRWRLDPAMAAQQDQMRPRVVASVRGAPGFIRGFWSCDVAEPAVNLTYVVFATRRQAEDFQRSVEANADAQAAAGVRLDELRVLEVTGHAGVESDSG